jgi:hypothetical protein
MSILSLSSNSFGAGSNKKAPPLPLHYDEYLVERIRDSDAKSAFYNDATYMNFLVYLSDTSTSSRQAIRVLKLAAEKLQELATKEQDSNNKRVILDEWRALITVGQKYAKNTNNQILKVHFDNLDYEEVQERFAMIASKPIPTSPEETEEELHLREAAAYRSGLEIYINDYLNRVISGLTEAPTVADYIGTVFEISFQEQKVAKKIGNVIHIAPKEERKIVYTVKILVPSKYAAEAVQVTTEILLKSALTDGVYFDDRIKIPSKLDPASYTLSLWGSNVLLTKPTCSRLFQ